MRCNTYNTPDTIRIEFTTAPYTPLHFNTIHYGTMPYLKTERNNIIHTYTCRSTQFKIPEEEKKLLTFAEKNQKKNATAVIVIHTLTSTKHHHQLLLTIANHCYAATATALAKGQARREALHIASFAFRNACVAWARSGWDELFHDTSSSLYPLTYIY